jgi:hypothetical protein
MPVPAAITGDVPTKRERALDIAVKHVNTIGGTRDYGQAALMDKARAVELFARFLIEGEPDGDE